MSTSISISEDSLGRRMARRARVLAARAALEVEGEHPSAAAVARRLGWSAHMAEAVVRDLLGLGLWPESAVPARRAPVSAETRAKCGRTGAKKPDVEAETAKIRADWTEDEELARRGRGRRVPAEYVTTARATFARDRSLGDNDA